MDTKTDKMENRTMKYLTYNAALANSKGEKRHPLIVMSIELGIRYLFPFQITGTDSFYVAGCANVPDALPPYIRDRPFRYAPEISKTKMKQIKMYEEGKDDCEDIFLKNKLAALIEECIEHDRNKAAITQN